jgi:hypothetical protein
MFNLIKTQWIGLVAIVFVAFGFFSSGVTEGLGALDRTTISNPWTFSDAVSLATSLDVTGAVSVGNFTEGGACTATSSSGILTEAVLLANNCITGTATGAGQAVITLTLPATSTMTTLIPNAGDCKAFVYNGQALAAATTTTFAAGTGWDIVGIDTNADVIAGLNNATLLACRETDTNVTGFISEYVPAD